MDVVEGEVLAGKYRIERVLGRGGMGVVVAAHHIQLDERVAIKFLLPEALGNAEAVARFAREARAAVKIKSEHVARVSDVGTLETGAPYMIMEYLDGGDLADWLSKRGPLTIEDAVEFVLQASEAVAEAHALGIVHRDLKPANLFVIRTADGRLSVKVLDFGISKVTVLGGSAPGASMTRTTALMGSPLYMSPEQMQTPKDVDARSDIWALGVILHELITGESPFHAELLPELIAKILAGAAPPLRSRRPDAPEGLERVVLRCLEKDRARRFESIGELAVALYPFGPQRCRISVDRISGVMRGAGLSVSGLALTSSSGAPEPPQQPAATEKGAVSNGSGTAASWGQTGSPSPAGNKTKTALGIGAAVVALVAVGIALVAKKPTPPASAQLPVDALHAVAAPTMPLEQAAAPTRLDPTVSIPSVNTAATSAAPVQPPPQAVRPLKTQSLSRSAAAKPVRTQSPPASPPASASPPPPPPPKKSTVNSLIDDRR